MHTQLLLLGEESSLINTVDIRGNTCLHFACSNGHKEVLLALISLLSHYTLLSTIHTPPSLPHSLPPCLIPSLSLYPPCISHSPPPSLSQCVKALLFHKVQCDINAANAQGDTPLHNAARWGYGELHVCILQVQKSLKMK